MFEPVMSEDEARVRHVLDAVQNALHRDGLGEWEACDSKIMNRLGDCVASKRQLRLSRSFILAHDNRAIKPALVELLRTAKRADGHTEAMIRIAPKARKYIKKRLGCSWRFAFSPPWVSGAIFGWHGELQEIRIDPRWAASVSGDELKEEIATLVSDVLKARTVAAG